MVGWSGLYNGNEQAQRCRGHPGLLHLQCTHQKISNTSLISVLSLQILMLTALVVLFFNISAHCTGHLGLLVHVQCNDPAGKLKKKLKIDQQPCRSRRLISLAYWSNIYLYHILWVASEWANSLWWIKLLWHLILYPDDGTTKAPAASALYRPSWAQKR